MTFSAALKPIQYLMKSDGEWEIGANLSNSMQNKLWK